MKNKIITGVMMLLSVVFVTAHADTFKVTVFNTANQAPLGYVTFTDTANGLLIKPMIVGLTPGMHGIHIHQNPSCAQHGDAAGAHYDPDKANQHAGPYAKGHRGDLPALFVNDKKVANLPTLAPHLTTKELRGHSLIIHVGADNYSDQPLPNGGGGARFACGVIK